MDFLGNAELEAANVVFLLDLQIGSRLFRSATRSIAMTDDQGEVYRYHGGLDEPTVSERLGRQEWDAPESSASLTAVLPGVSIAYLRAQGHSLIAARGVLYMVTTRDGVPLQTMEDRYLVVAGRVIEPEYAGPDDPAGLLAFTLREEPWENQQALVPAQAILSPDTWAALPDDSQGKVCPTVIGSPGVYTDVDGTEQLQPGSPAYVLTTSAGNAVLILVAGHVVAAPTVTIIDDDGAIESFAVSHQADLLGRVVAVVDVSSAGTIDRALTKFWAAWDGGGGMINPFGGGALTIAPHVVAWALQTAGLPVDIGRWMAVADRLPSLRISTYINDQESTAWEWLTAHVLPLLPITVRRNALGAYPVLYDAGDRSDRTVASLVDGRNVRRRGRVMTARRREEFVSRVVVCYAPTADGNGPTRVLTVTAGASPSIPDESGGLYTEHAAALFTGERVYTLRAVHDVASASSFALSQARVLNEAYETVEYDAGGALGWLPLGGKVAITDADAVWSSAVAMVAGRSYRRPFWTFTLQIGADPIRDSYG